jgi:hypothetical protein
MNAVKVAAIVLIVAGGLMLISGSVSYIGGHPRSQVSSTPVKPEPSAPPPPASEAALPAAKTTAAAAALDLKTLEQQLKDTKAIGFFTKITLKNQVDDLLDQFRNYHRGKTKLTMADLHRSYDLLMMKLLSLLQDEDQELASAIVSSREAIWALLADPTTFATLEG